MLLPLRAAKLARELAPRVGQISVMDVALGLAEGLPTRPVLRLGHRELRAHGAVATPTAPTTSGCSTNELYLAATDLDTCERIVFGAEDWDDIPISTRRRAPRRRCRWSTSR